MDSAGSLEGYAFGDEIGLAATLQDFPAGGVAKPDGGLEISPVGLNGLAYVD